MSSKCANCKVCNYAQKNPETLVAKIWRWHTKWCPRWKAYQRELAEAERRCSAAAPELSSSSA